MHLTLQAIKYMIWFRLFGGLMMLVLFGMSPDRVGFSPFIPVLADVSVLYVFSIGLRREYVWVAIAFFLFCIFDIFGALTGGLELTNLVNLADAVLSFVAICGIVIWFRDRPTTESPA